MSDHFEAKAREILEKIDRDRNRSDIHPAQARDEHIGAIANALAEATERAEETVADEINAIAVDLANTYSHLPKDKYPGPPNQLVERLVAIATAIRGRSTPDE